MKPLFCLLICNLLWLNLVHTQTEPEEFATYTEVQPSFPGGEKEMLKFIHSNFRVPAGVPMDSVHGSLIVLSFLIDTVGSLSDFRILKDMGPGFGDEAIRVMKTMPPWIPGGTPYKRTRIRYTLPIRIRLE